jgi:hypothetical protein
VKSICSLCRMLAAAPAGFECTLGGCPREFVEIDRAEFMRILRKEAGLLPVRKRRRPSRRRSGFARSWESEDTSPAPPLVAGFAPDPDPILLVIWARAENPFGTDRCSRSGAL